ncbi:MAG: hypothetical protein ACYSW0_21905, partial [Planctomycetota bacterium]|jgi:hypothetical protein
LLTILVTVEWHLLADDASHLAHHTSLRTIMSPGHYLSNRVHFIAGSVLIGLTCAGFVVIIRLLVRHALISAVLSVAVLALPAYDMYFNQVGDSKWGALAYAIGTSVLLVWLCTRVGVLAAMFFSFIVFSAGLFTIAFDDWTTPYILALLAVVLLLALYGSCSR